MRKTMLWMAALVMLVPGVLRAQESAAKPQDLVGNWQGTLEAGKGLRTIVKVTKDDGKLKGVMYSIDQGGQPLALTTVSLDGKTVNFAIKALDVVYVGTMNPDGNTITGSATQNGQTHALNLTRVTAEAMWPIPEPPKPMAADAKPVFEVVTIKPSQPGRPGKGVGFRGRHYMGLNINVYDLMGFAYQVHVKQVIGAPAWWDSDLYDIDGVPDVEGVPNSKQTAMMLQQMLADRFQLVFHRDKRELAVYAITVGKGGPKMTPSESKPDAPQAFFFRRLGDLTVRNQTMTDFANWMQTVLDKPVVNQTDLKDRYDFTLKWTPDNSQFAQFRSTGVNVPTPTDDPNAPPSLNTAIQEQLGLKLDPVKTAADVLVIDHVEKPSAN